MNDSKIRDEAPLLFSLQKKNVHQVPADFFGDLEKEIRRQYPRAGIRLKRMKKWIELSAAAAIIGFMLFSGIKIMSSKQYMPVQTDRTIYNIKDGDMDGKQVLPAASLNPQ